MQGILAAALLSGILGMLLGCSGSPRQHSQDSSSICQLTAQCDDWAVYQQTLQEFLRGSMADIPGDRNHKPDLQQAYLRMKAAYYNDEQFACRQPLTARYLESLWQLPTLHKRCSDSLPFRAKGLISMENVRWIDPQRVQAVHLLFMGESEQAFSRYGHVALRLIVCSEERTRVGPECEEDVFDHMVLSFAAGIADPTLSLWKGLVGGYDIGLFATDFYDIYQQYTIDEFRSLTSVPIILSGDEKTFLVQALSEVHWRYTNDYRFFSQNCASELQWVLNTSAQALSFDALPLLQTPRVRPDKLFTDALSQPRFEAAVLDNLEAAEHRGHYFPSAEPYYQHALRVLAQQLGPADMQAIDGPQSWLEAGAHFRAAQLTELVNPSAAPDRSSLDAYLVLETWAVRKMQRALVNSLFSSHGQDLTKLMHSPNTPSNEHFLRCMSSLLMPEGIEKSSTGIPGANSILLEQRCKTDQDDFMQGAAALIKEILRKDVASNRYRTALSEIQAAIQNIETAQKKRAVLFKG